MLERPNSNRFDCMLTWESGSNWSEIGMPIEVLRRRQVAFPHIITEMKIPPLNVDERKHLIKSILMRYHKKLDDRPMNNQMRVLIKKSECSSPLYITVACEELRVFGVYERLADRIKV